MTLPYISDSENYSGAMKSALIFLAIVALCHGIPTLMTPVGRIVNGEDVGEGEIPYQVSLQSFWGSHFCGGSVLNEKYVITAAHCVVARQNHKNFIVVAGTTNLTVNRSVHTVSNVIVHAEYNPQKSFNNDIALVEVSPKFVVSNTIAFVPLPTPDQQVADGATAIVSGWGRLRLNGPLPVKLQRAAIKIANLDYCRQVYDSISSRPNVYDTQICASNPDYESGACNGDSGGPLTVEGTLTGIVSWSYGCALTKYPTVYTRVSKYIDWIETNAV